MASKTDAYWHVNINAKNIMNIVAMPQICRNFPLSPLSKLDRESQLDAIDKAFSGSVQIVFMGGEEGIGKTTILAQFMERHPESTIGIFITPFSRASYSKEYINIAVTEQLFWMFEGKRFSFDVATSADVQKLMLRIQKLAKTRPIYFVVDGLEEINAGERQGVVDYLFQEVLQLGMREFRYIVSGSQKALVLPGVDRLQTQTYQVLPFDREQIRRYFSGHDLTDENLNDLKAFSQGVPFRLEVALRWLQNGNSLDEVLSLKHGVLSDFFEIDWQRVDATDAIHQLALALAAFATRPTTLDEISRLSGADKGDLAEFFSVIQFVEVEPSSMVIRFRSELQRQLIMRKLDRYVTRVKNIFIDDLLLRPNDKDSISFLLEDLSQEGRDEQILGRLDNEYFRNLLTHEQSMATVRRHAEIGRISAGKLSGAGKLTNIPNLIQFGITGSVLLDLELASPSRSLLKALLKLEKHEEAISLACSASTKEERFALLATIGKYLIVEKRILPTELRDQIENASRHVDFKTLGPKGFEIANDLIAINPDLAITVLNTSIDRRAKPIERDVAFASLHANMSNLDISTPSREAAQKKAHDQISDRRMQNFAEAAATIFSKYDAKKVIERIKRLDIEHRIYFSKIWIDKNFKNENAFEVAEYALDLMVEQVDYVPKLADFRAIARVLPFMGDHKKAQEISQSIEAQKTVVAAHGTSEDYVRLQMIFIQAESNFNLARAKERAVEIYSRVDDIEDIGTKTACFAWMLHYLHDIVELQSIENATNVQSSVASRLVESIETLLTSTVDHYSVAKRAVDALAANNTLQAYDLAGRLNTCQSRNKAFGHLARALVKSRSHLKSYGHLIDSVRRITTLIARDRAMLDLLVQLENNEDFNLNIHRANDVISLWKELGGPEVRALALVYTFGILYINYANVAKDLDVSKNLSGLWDEIPSGAHKFNLGFQIVELLATFDRPLAEDWLKRLQRDLGGHLGASDESETAVISALSLSVRSFSALVKMKVSDEVAWKRLTALVNSVPGVTERIRVWVDLAIRCWAARDKALSDEVAIKYIRPIIDAVPEHYISLRSYLIIEAAPALYVYNANLAESYLSSIPQEEQDIGRDRIYLALHSKLSPYDPKSDSILTEYSIDYARALDITVVLGKMKYDANLYHAISALCDSLSAKKNKTNITFNQKKKILDMLSEIIEKSFPDPLNIRHNGYKLVAQAKVLKARSEFEKVDFSLWESLRSAVEDIPNVADQAIVLCIIASQASSKNTVIAKKWLGEAKEFAKLIPSVRDRIDRYRWMSEIAGKIDTGFCQGNLREAFMLSDTLESNDDVEEKQRRILDIAHQIDAKFADDLIDLVDRDPVRKKNKDELSSHLKVLNTRKKNFSRDIFDEESLSDKELIEFASRNFQSLLNDRFNTRPILEMLPMLIRAADISLSGSLSIWSWFIENVNRRFEQSPKEVIMLTSISNACFDAAELSIQLSIRNNMLVSGDGPNSNLFRDGERAEAMLKMRKWIQNCVESELLISDPFFGPDDLEVLRIVQEEKPAVKIRLLLSGEYVSKFAGEQNIDDLFHRKWADISDQDPPRTDIVIVGIKPTGRHPLHDRWMVSNRSGIRIGTSVNAIGMGRTSEISNLTESEAVDRINEINSFLNRDIRELAGKKISYQVIDM